MDERVKEKILIADDESENDAYFTASGRRRIHTQGLCAFRVGTDRERCDRKVQAIN